MKRVISFGSINIDHVYRLAHIVLPGETIAAESYSRYWGGKGLNQAVALARAGASTAMAGKAGKAEYEALLALCEKNGIDASGVGCFDGPTGHAIIQVSDDGQNSIVIFGGANSAITEEDICSTLSRFSTGDILLLQNEVSNVPFLIEEGRRRGLFVVLNPSPYTEKMLSWPLELVDMFVLNEIEGAALSGAKSEDDICPMLLKKYPACRVMLTLGSRGSIYQDSSRRIVTAAEKVEAVDTTAAGDTFTGYLLARLAEGGSIEEAVAMATHAAAIAVTRPGATDSIPTLEQVQGAE